MTLAVNIAQSGSNNVTFRNRIINGAMVIAQRGTSTFTQTTSTTYCLDRWATYGSGGSQFTAQQLTASPPTGYKNYLGVVNSASPVTPSTVQEWDVFQYIEGYNIADLGWGASGATSVTLSFWVKSSVTGTFGASICNYNSTRTYPFNYTINTANTWEQKNVTIPGDTSGTWYSDNSIGMGVLFSMGAGSSKSGTANTWAGTNYTQPTGSVALVATASATWQVTGVQLEAGTTASPFEYRSFGQELALCQRYYEKSFAQGTAPAFNQSFNFTTGTVYVGTSISIPIIPFKVTKRAAPTMTFYGVSTSGWRYYAGGFANLASFSGGANDTYFYAEGSGTSGLSQYQSSIIGGNWTAEIEL